MAKNLITTPRGIFLYPYLNEADTKFNPEGVYRVRFKAPAEVMGDIIEAIDAAMEQTFNKAVVEEKSPAKRKRIKRADAPYMEQDDGTIEINFKMKASGTRKKDGKTWTRRPAVFDGAGNYIPSDKLPMIGGGTEGKVSFEIAGFYTPLVGAGVSLRLNGVQILNLVEYGGGSAEDHGFEAEDGAYTVNSMETIEEVEQADTEDEVSEDTLKDF